MSEVSKIREHRDDQTSLGTSIAADTTDDRTDPGFIPLEMFDYEIAKWMANAELKRQKKGVEEELARHDRLKVLARVTPFAAISDYIMGGANLQRENQSLLIDEYWSPVSIEVKYKGLTKDQIRGVLVLQNAFRTWIILKRYREVLKSKATPGSRNFGDMKHIATALYIQSSVRRVLAKMTVKTKMEENKARDKAFAKFCGELKKGVPVIMFSRKYGTSPERILSIDDKINNLTFSTSFGTKGKIDLKSVFKVHTGISETMYANSRQPQLSRCICLECLAERVVDLELTTAKQTREMYLGFERMILLLSGTASPFYTDNFGIPRRAGPSIIENAINESTTSDEDLEKRIYTSKPDEMRFWAALRTLQQEYDGWQGEQDAERREFVRQADIEAEKVASRLRTSEREQNTVVAFGPTNRVTKLVRFLGDDGVVRMREIPKEESVADNKSVTLASGSKTPPEERSSKAKRKEEKRNRKYDEENEKKRRKWPMNPFRKKSAPAVSGITESSPPSPAEGQTPPGRSTMADLFGEVEDDESYTSYSKASVSVMSGSKSLATGRGEHYAASTLAAERRREAAPREDFTVEALSISPKPVTTANPIHPSDSSVKSADTYSEVSSFQEKKSIKGTRPFWKILLCLSPDACGAEESDSDYFIPSGKHEIDQDNASQTQSQHSNWEAQSNTEVEDESSGDDSDDDSDESSRDEDEGEAENEWDSNGKDGDDKVRGAMSRRDKDRDRAGGGPGNGDGNSEYDQSSEDEDEGEEDTGSEDAVADRDDTDEFDVEE